MDHKTIIEQFGTPAELAKALGQKPNTVRMWVARNSIPGWHWNAVVAAAKDRGVDVTLADLASATEAA